MNKCVNFSKSNVSVNWQYVKRNFREMGILTEYLDIFETRAHKAVQELIQSDIYEEFEEQIGAGKYERAGDARQDFRKGEYARFLTTTFGRSEILIPRTQKGTKIEYSLFEKYQRRQKKFDEMIVMSMILGFSVRKQHKFFKEFLGDAVSHGTASRLMRTLDNSLSEFRTKKITDEYKYLLVDGIWIHVMESGKVKNRPIIVVMGIKTDNTKEILAFKLTEGETEVAITSVLNDLYRRGLEGKSLKIVASDGAKGIKAALENSYPYAKWQLCSTHKLRNLCGHIEQKTKHRKKIMKEASQIYKSKTRKEAVVRFGKFCRRWERVEHKAIRLFKKDFEKTLTFYDYSDDRNFTSTTNHLERDLEEIRRRIKTQGYFKNERSLNYWVYGILKYSERIKQPKGAPSSPMGEDIKGLEYESVHNS